MPASIIPRFLDELKDLLRIPSISTAPGARRRLPSCRGNVGRRTQAHRHGKRAPHRDRRDIRWCTPTGCMRRASRRCLRYGHYDVQPPDPLDEWHTPPFEPTERNGNLYARGAVDDKGQMYMHVKAFESLLAATERLPINVRVLFEGEEEVGGEGIAAFVASKPAELKADFALVSDTEMFAPGLPTLVRGPARHDLYRTRSPRRQNRPAFRHVRRRRTQSFCRRWRRSSPGSRTRTDTSLSPAFTTTSFLPALKSYRRGAAFPSTKRNTASTKSDRKVTCRAKRATAFSSAPGRVPRSMCTAFPADSPAWARKP